MPSIHFIVPAAGTGSRMQAVIPKQYLELNNIPILHYTLRLLLKSSLLKKGVIGLSQDDDYYSYPNTNRLCCVNGGKSRAETVYNALLYLEGHSIATSHDWIVVHDAVRPGLSVDELDNFITSVLHDNLDAGGIMAVPAQDTIKSIDDNNIIKSTFDRDHIWLAQTPQMCKFSILLKAYKNALEKGINITDEASVLEYNGLFPKVYQGFRHNFKVTYPDDLELMHLYLQARTLCE